MSTLEWIMAIGLGVIAYLLALILDSVNGQKKTLERIESFIYQRFDK